MDTSITERSALSQAYLIGKEDERNRIIKIIEAGCDCFYDEKCANHILIMNINKNWE
jgi:hypothetical protein